MLMALPAVADAWDVDHQPGEAMCARGRLSQLDHGRPRTGLGMIGLGLRPQAARRTMHPAFANPELHAPGIISAPMPRARMHAQLVQLARTCACVIATASGVGRVGL